MLFQTTVADRAANLIGSSNYRRGIKKLLDSPSATHHLLSIFKQRVREEMKDVPSALG